MDAAEVRGILKSVYRYRARWWKGVTKQSFRFRQALRGRKGGTASGLARWANVSDRDRFILVRLEAGESQRAVGRAFWVSQFTVRTARDRLIRGVSGEANTVSTVRGAVSQFVAEGQRPARFRVHYSGKRG